MRRISILLALGISVAYAQNVCTVGDGSCVLVSDPGIFHPIEQKTFTATAVLADSGTICGKDSR